MAMRRKTVRLHIDFFGSSTVGTIWKFIKETIYIDETMLIYKWHSIYFFEVFLADFFSFSCCSFKTLLTIFCSSIKKALTILSLTQLAHLEPP